MLYEVIPCLNEAEGIAHTLAALDVYNNQLGHAAREEQLDNAWGPGFGDEVILDTLEKYHFAIVH